MKKHWTQTRKGRAFMRRTAKRRFNHSDKVEPVDIVVAKPIESFFDRLWSGLSTNDKGYALCSLIDREMKKL
jgi:hypothetical protein